MEVPQGGGSLGYLGPPSLQSVRNLPGGLTVEQASAAIDNAVASAVESGDAGVIMGMLDALVSVPIARCSERRSSGTDANSPLPPAFTLCWQGVAHLVSVQVVKPQLCGR